MLGFWSVDIKNRLKFFTDNPDNTQMQRLVLRGETHHRQRPQNARFVVGSDMDSLTKREIGDDQWNWLGWTWSGRYNNYGYPCLSQIEQGLIAEAMFQIELAMGKFSE